MEKNRDPGNRSIAMRVYLDSKEFEKSINNVVQYSMGFIDGVKAGKTKFLANLGVGVIEALNQYIDSMARSSPEAMHHVYEWYQTGSPNARLFNLTYTISNLGLSVKSSFSQSMSLSGDNTEPFYDKARIMELGIPVTISPRRSEALVFEDGGTTVFTKRPITIANPGGTQVVGSYERTFDSFFKNYFTQAFLRASGLFNYIENPIAYKKNIAQGARGGRQVGQKTGYAWIVNAKIGVE